MRTVILAIGADEELYIEGGRGQIETVEKVYNTNENGEPDFFMYEIVSIEIENVADIVWVDEDGVHWVVDLYEETENGIGFILTWKKK